MMLIPLLLFMMGMVVMLALMPVFVLVFCRRTQSLVVRRIVGFAILLGYIGGGMAAWSLVTPEWQMSLQETLTASVNAAKYGDPTEHYAQEIVVMMLFASTVGALISGSLAAVTARVWQRPNA